jgi:hypothetical protein
MAMYKEDLPAGVDLQFNTKKSSTGNKRCHETAKGRGKILSVLPSGSASTDSSGRKHLSHEYSERRR